MNVFAHTRCSVEELSCVTDLSGWRSARVRAIGRLQCSDIKCGPAYLYSVDECHGPHQIQVDTRLLDTAFLPSDIVEVFGELSLENGSSILLAKFAVSVTGINLANHRRAVQLLSDGLARRGSLSVEYA